MLLCCVSFAECHFSEYCYAECPNAEIFMLSVVMLNMVILFDCAERCGAECRHAEQGDQIGRFLTNWATF